MEHAAAEDPEELFARLAVQQGLVAPDQAEECLRLLRKLREAGVTPLPRIGELLARRGFLGDAASRTLQVGASRGPESPTPCSELSAEAAAAAADPANRIGRYVRVSRLGAGGGGEVWKAWDGELGRWVALKFLRDNDPGRAALLEREAQTAARLAHPNIATVYEAGRHDGRPFIAMQLVEGCSLAEFPRDDPRVLVELLTNASRAVEYAHGEGVIHRDLKPHNIMVEDAPSRGGSSTRRALAPAARRVVVLDFGLAKHTAVDSSVSVSGCVIGTPAYMPPEQAQGEAGRATARSDVYSLGATLYELLCGTPPFPGNDLCRVLLALAQEEPVPLRKRNPRIDPDLEVIVARCLEKEPERRYPSAGELAADLQRYLDGEAIVARPPSLGYRLRKRIGRNKLLAASLGALLLVIGGASALVSVQSARRAAEKEGQRAEAERQAAAFKREADAAHGREDWPAALEALGKYLALRPGDARALELRADCERALAEQGRDAADKPVALEAAELTRRAAEALKEGRALQRSRAARRGEWEAKFQQAQEQALAAVERYPKLASAHHTLGEVRETRGRWREALAEYETARSLDPALADAWYRSGVCHLRFYHALQATLRRSAVPGLPGSAEALETVAASHKGAALKALRTYSELRGLAGRESAEHRYFDAVLAMTEGRLEAAQRHCELLLEESRTDERVWLLKAEVQLSRSHYAAAAETLGTLVTDVMPQLSDGWYARALAYQAVKKWDEALADCERALALEPDVSLFHHLRGTLHQGKGDLKAAEADYGRAIALDPSSLAAISARGYIRFQKEDGEGLLEDARRYLELRPADPIGHNLEGMAQMRLKNLDAAAAAFTRAIELAPQVPTYAFNRAKMLQQKGEYEAAERDFAEAVARAPDSVLYLSTRARNFWSMNRNEEAVRAASEAIRLNPAASAAFAVRGAARFRLKDPAGARSDLDRAVELDPSSVFARFNRAVARNALGDRAGAESDCDRVLELDQKNGHALELRARCRIVRGEHAGALADLREAIRLQPTKAEALKNLVAECEKALSPR